jgi:pimeloyl-ACP methyl ester carboxylesterase
MQGGYYFTTGSSFSISSPLHTSYTKNISCANSRLDGVVTSHQSCQPQQTTTTSIFVPLNVTAEQAEKFKVDMQQPSLDLIYVSVPLPDGRTLQVLTSQIKSNYVVILHHGTPSSCDIWKEAVEMFAAVGIKAFAYSRAGYFKSSRKVGRTVIDNNDDIKAIIEYFKITSFVSFGVQGGGPFALVNGFLTECKNIVLLNPVGVYKGNPDFFTYDNGSMDPDIRAAYTEASKGKDALEAYISQKANTLKNIFSPNDAVLLQDPTSVNSKLVSTDFTNAVSNGFGGWVDDFLAFVNPNGWGGQDLSTITVPILLIYGNDPMVSDGQYYFYQQILPSNNDFLISMDPNYGTIGTGPLSLVLPPNLKELVKANANTIVNISDLSDTSKTLIERIRLYPAINNI